MKDGVGTKSEQGLDLAPFLRPRSIVLIGASTNEASIAGRPASFLQRMAYPGTVTAIHPTARYVGGYPAVPDVMDLDHTPDVAMVLRNAEHVLGSLQQCAAIGTRSAVVIASGFEGEAGERNREGLEAFLRAAPEFRLIGPNCNGVLSVETRTPLCFSSVLLENELVPGEVSVVTQSGAVGNALLLALHRRGTGLKHLISSGDELSIGAVELATQLLYEDSRCVGLFLEGLTDAQALPALAEAIEETGKPVVAFRARQSMSSRAAAYAHTGRIIGDDHIGRQALVQHGVRLVDDLEGLADALTVMSVLPEPTMDRNYRVGILTVSGGLGVVAAEAIEQEVGLELASFEGTGTQELLERLLEGVPVSNPLDVPLLGDTDRFLRAMVLLQESEACDLVLVVASSLAHDYDALSRVCPTGGAPVVLTHLSPEERFTAPQARRLVANGPVAVPSVASAVNALGLWVRGGRRSDVRRSTAAHTGYERKDARQAGRQHGVLTSLRHLGEDLTAYMPAMREVDSIEDVSAVVSDGRSRVALKAEGSVLTHRSDVGAVRTNIDVRRPRELAEAFRSVKSVCEQYGERMVAQVMAAAGVEIMLSVVWDKEVGATVLLQPGGILADLSGKGLVLVGESRNWFAQIESAEGIGNLLNGYRGAPPADIRAVVEVAAKIQKAVQTRPQIELVECNPVLVRPRGQGLSIVDMVTVINDV